MLSNLFYRNPRLTALTLGLIVVAGWLAFNSLGRQEDPALTRRFASIVTFLPGADALRIESLVTEPIEDVLREIPEINEITSESRAGTSFIRIELKDEVMEPDQVWSKVQNKLTEIEGRLPPGTTRPDLEDRSSTAVTIVVALAWDQPGPPQVDILTRLGEDLENRLLNISGTREADIHGAADEEILVTVDPVALASLGLTIEDVSRAAALGDAKVSAGIVRNATNDLTIEVSGEFKSVSDVAELPIRQTPDGRTVRLRDVAQVTKGVRDPPRSVGLVAGKRAVFVSAEMEGGGRIDLWAARAKEVIGEFAADLPRGVELTIPFDQEVYTSARLDELSTNMILGALVVMVILLITLGWKSALVVSLALPLSVLMVFIVFNILGMPLHQTSMVGIIVSLGLLIDNAIVVIDDFNVARARGLEPGEAISETIGHLFVPLFASTLTTCLAFAPIFLMPGGAGEFVGPLSIGVIIALTSSFFLSMTVIPAIAGFVSSRSDGARAGQGPWWQTGYSDPELTDVYSRFIRLILRRPLIGIGVSVILPILGFVMAGTLKEQFFPANDRDMFQMQVFLPPQSSLAQTRAVVDAVRARLNTHPAIVESHWVIGDPAPRVYYAMNNASEGLQSYAGAFVRTTDWRATLAELPRLQAELRAAFPQATVLALPFEQGPPVDAPVELRIVGPEVDRLREEGEKIRAIMQRSPGVTYTVAKLTGGQPKLLVATDRDEARMAGLAEVEIARQLQAALDGAVGGSVVEATEELPVRVRMPDDRRGQVETVRSSYLLPAQRGAAPAGPSPGAPVDAVGSVGLTPEISGITRRNGERTNTIQAYIVPFMLPAEVLEDIMARLAAAGYEPPRGYRLEVGGDAEQRSETLSRLAAFAGPLFVLMAASIILSFNSFRLAGIVFLVAFLSVGLALWGVWLFGYPLGFVAIVGTMGLVGLAINGAIVVLSALKADPAAMAGEEDAVERVVVGASRHIISTTLTTIGGFTPLILFGGRFWQPMATAIAGGVGGSAILALVLTPALFMIMARRGAARAAPARAARGPGLPR